MQVEHRLNGKFPIQQFRVCLHETGNKILFRIEKNYVYIAFNYVRNEMKFRLEVDRSETAH